MSNYNFSRRLTGRLWVFLSDYFLRIQPREGVRNQYNMTLNYSKRNFNEFQTALSDMNTQNQFNKISVFECQTISENIQKLSKKNSRTFKYFCTNSRIFKALNFQILYEPWIMQN